MTQGHGVDLIGQQGHGRLVRSLERDMRELHARQHREILHLQPLHACRSRRSVVECSGLRFRERDEFGNCLRWHVVPIANMDDAVATRDTGASSDTA